MKINTDNLKTLEYWILERERVRKNKEARMPRPWTVDPILDKFHFCNVRREDDRGTKERRKVVLDHDLYESALPSTYTASNLFNKASTLNLFLQERDDFVSIAQAERAKGMTIFHVAYVVSTCGAKMDKIEYCEDIIQEVEVMTVPQTSCREAFDALRGVSGLGSFLAGQIIADLKNDRYLANTPDWDTFSVVGPGSKKGLDFLFGPGTTEGTYDARMLELEKAMSPEVHFLKLHRQDLQNCLCEFSKYMRYKHDLPGRRRPYQ